MNGFADALCHIFVLPVTCASTIQKSIYSSLSSLPTGEKHTLAKSGMKPRLQPLKATWNHFRPEPSHHKPKPLQQLGSASIRLGLFGLRLSSHAVATLLVPIRYPVPIGNFFSKRELFYLTHIHDHRADILASPFPNLYLGIYKCIPLGVPGQSVLRPDMAWSSNRRVWIVETHIGR